MRLSTSVTSSVLFSLLTSSIPTSAIEQWTYPRPQRDCCSIWDYSSNTCTTLSSPDDLLKGIPCASTKHRPDGVPPGCAQYLNCVRQCVQCCDIWEFEDGHAWEGKSQLGKGKCLAATGPPYEKPFGWVAITECQASLYDERDEVPEGCRWWMPWSGECLTEEEAIVRVEELNRARDFFEHA
ncbi:hypothetical protein LTR85_011246 [Meristemomyces frigidus]|nr:hypothetical protein LTR85_011246 [Meristemomyces frigidus]